jgi:carbon starvation protein
MLLEAMVAIVSLCCVMMFAVGSPQLSGGPNQVFAQGIGRFLEVIHLPPQVGITFALMAFTTFVYDTLDVCTRLGRYILQELTGWHGRAGRTLGTALTAGVPLFFLLGHKDPNVPVWRIFWDLFGASNQLLAALTLLGVTVWLWRTRGAWWVWVVTGIPTAVMYVTSTWALASMTIAKFRSSDGTWHTSSDVVGWIGIVLILLAAMMLYEAAIAIFTWHEPPRAKAEPALAH